MSLLSDFTFRGFTLCTLLLSPTTYAAPEDLRDLLLAARKTTPALDLARSRMMEAEAKAEQADGALWPKVSIEASVAPSFGTTLTSLSPISYTQDFSDWSVFLRTRAEIKQALWTFGRIQAYRDAAAHGVEAGKNAESLALHELDYQVRKLFFGFSATQQGVNFTNTLLENIQDRIKQGKASSELRQTEVQLRLLLTKLKADRNAAVFALSLFTGFPEAEIQEMDLELDPEPVKKNLSFDPLLEALPRVNPEVRLLESLAASKQSLVEAKERELYPIIGLMLFAEARYAPNVSAMENPFLVDDFNRDSLGVGVGLTWQFDWLTQEGQRNEARAASLQSRSEFQLLLLRKKMELREKYESWNAAQEGLKIHGPTYKNYRRSIVKSRLGMASGGRDITDTIKKMAEARRQYAEAVYQANTAVAELAKLVGADAVFPEASLKNL